MKTKIKTETMEKGDILTAIDPCIMNDTKEKALDVGKNYKVLRVFFCPGDKVKTFEIKSNIGMHTFEVDAAQDFFELLEGGDGEILPDVAYWRNRCLLAEKCLSVSPCDPDITNEQINAHKSYNQFLETFGNKD